VADLYIQPPNLGEGRADRTAGRHRLVSTCKRLSSSAVGYTTVRHSSQNTRKVMESSTPRKEGQPVLYRINTKDPSYLNRSNSGLISCLAVWFIGNSVVGIVTSVVMS